MDKFWLQCKSRTRRGKYPLNTKDIGYDYQKRKLHPAWDLVCKFCNKPLDAGNLGDTTLSNHYISLIVKYIDSQIDE